MKKFFKLFAVALVAGCMFTACGDKNNGENPGENPGDNPTGANTYTIQFEGNAAWNAASTMFIDYTAEGYLTVVAFKVADDQNNEYVQGFLETATGNHTYESTGGDCMTYRNPNDLYTDVNGVLGGNPGDQYYRWNMIKEQFTESITACDLNALTMSCTWNQPCFDVEQYVAAQGQDYGVTKNLTGKMDAYKFTLTPAQK